MADGTVSLAEPDLYFTRGIVLITVMACTASTPICSECLSRSGRRRRRALFSARSAR
jgi:hypothetical protein